MIAENISFTNEDELLVQPFDSVIVIKKNPYKILNLNPDQQLLFSYQISIPICSSIKTPIKLEKGKFRVPSHYITYKEKDRKERFEQNDKYELTVFDHHFLKMIPKTTEEELSNIINLLENNILDSNSLTLISIDKARDLICQLYPDKKSDYEKIYMYWINRIEEFRKPLMRKNWKKFNNDVYLKNTFKKTLKRNKVSKVKLPYKFNQLQIIKNQMILVKQIIISINQKENLKKSLLKEEIDSYLNEKYGLKIKTEETGNSIVDITNKYNSRSNSVINKSTIYKKKYSKENKRLDTIYLD